MNIHDKKPSSTSNLLKKVSHLIKKYRKTSWAICLCLALLLGGLTAYVVFSNQPEKNNIITKKPIKKADPIKYYSPLTGLEVKDEKATKAVVTGIMVENSPEARPQSGLKDSGVVFEAIAEGGITRFLVLYQDEKPQLIGPVRSVRPYYISWAAGFNPSIAHVGGSADALVEIRNGQYRDLDQFSHSEAYWRTSDRYAPHNVYTSFEKLDTLNKSLGYLESDFVGFTREPIKKEANPTIKTTNTTGESNPDDPAAPKTANSINVNVSSFLFNSSYTYDQTTNKYTRYQAGAIHDDREEGAITPSAVIVMHVNQYLSGNAKNNLITDTVSSGKAVIFQNGTAIEGTWTKPSQFEQIKFTDETNKEVELVRGQTWIAAVPNDNGSVTYN